MANSTLFGIREENGVSRAQDKLMSRNALRASCQRSALSFQGLISVVCWAKSSRRAKNMEG